MRLFVLYGILTFSPAAEAHDVLFLSAPDRSFSTDQKISLQKWTDEVSEFFKGWQAPLPTPVVFYPVGEETRFISGVNAVLLGPEFNDTAPELRTMFFHELAHFALNTYFEQHHLERLVPGKTGCFIQAEKERREFLNDVRRHPAQAEALLAQILATEAPCQEAVNSSGDQAFSLLTSSLRELFADLVESVLAENPLASFRTSLWWESRYSQEEREANYGGDENFLLYSQARRFDATATAAFLKLSGDLVLGYSHLRYAGVRSKMGETFLFKKSSLPAILQKYEQVLTAFYSKREELLPTGIGDDPRLFERPQVEKEAKVILDILDL